MDPYRRKSPAARPAENMHIARRESTYSHHFLKDILDNNLCDFGKLSLLQRKFEVW